MQEIVSHSKEQVFVEGVLRGEKLDVAARKAGFSHPARDAYPILNTQKVRTYFRAVVRGKAETEGLTLALNYMTEVIRDEKNDKKLRLEAAKFIYGHHMPAVKARESDDDSEKQPSEMSNEELRAFIEQSEAELAARATPIAQALDDYL